MFPYSCKILVCDDSKVSRVMLKNVLLKMGYKNVIESQSGFQAVDLLEESCLKKEQFDLVFMDIIMPGISGIDTVKKIRELDESMKKVPIVMVSAEAERTTVINALVAGANDYILKPIEPQSVCDKVQTLWEKLTDEMQMSYISKYS